MDIFDGPNWFGIAFGSVFIVGPSLFLVGFDALVWFAVGSRRAWAAVAGLRRTTLFPRTSAQEHRTRRRIIWTIRGVAAGSALATVVMALIVGLALPLFDDVRGWFSSYGEWFTTGFPAVGAAIGASLAVRIGGTRAVGRPPQQLRDYVPRWLTATSVAAVGLVVAAVVIVGAAISSNVFESGIGISAMIALVSLSVFLLAWRPLLSWSVGELSPGWSDVARATALWMLALLPVVMSLTAARSLIHWIAYAEGPVTTPLTVLASVLTLGVETLHQAVLIVALLAAPLYVAKQRYPDRYRAIRNDWAAARQYRRAARGSTRLHT